MNKSQTLLKSGTSEKFDKMGEGDLVFALQANRVNESEKGYQMDTNMDWSFDDETSPNEIISLLGSTLSSIEDVFGEKMVTEAILHYAEERGHLVKTPQGAGFHFRSRGLQFKDWKKK